jgi:hypothetical protein
MRWGVAGFVVACGAWLMASACGSGAPSTAGTPATQAGTAGQADPPPQFEVDPSWPRPFPLVKDADGNYRRWVTGETGGTCVDSHDHIFTLNRGWQQSGLGKLQTFEGMSGIPAPPVVAYDPDGNVVTSWGDASLLAPGGGTTVMPESLHGCFVDYENNVWLAGNNDGIVQKYTHDGQLPPRGLRGAAARHRDHR